MDKSLFYYTFVQQHFFLKEWYKLLTLNILVSFFLFNIQLLTTSLINQIESTFTDVFKDEAILFSQRELNKETNKLTFNFVLNMIYHVLSAVNVAYNSMTSLISALPYFRSLITNHLNTANLGYVESLQIIKAKNTNSLLKKASVSKDSNFYDLIKLIQESLHGDEKVTF